MPKRSVPRKILAHLFPILISLLSFAAALYALPRALGEFHYYQVLHHLQMVPGWRILLALRAEVGAGAAGNPQGVGCVRVLCLYGREEHHSRLAESSRRSWNG